MELKSSRLIYFSPTNTTRLVVEAIARGFDLATPSHLNLTSPSSQSDTEQKIADDLVVLGAPVYGGRVPPTAAQRIRRLRGNGAPAVVVVVYGNRAYDDALLELRDLAQEIGFWPVAAGAFVGEHSFATDTLIIANGRPDAGDRGRAEVFGGTVFQNLAGRHDIHALPKLHVPGTSPYRDHIPPGVGARCFVVRHGGNVCIRVFLCVGVALRGLKGVRGFPVSSRSPIRSLLT